MYIRVRSLLYRRVSNSCTLCHCLLLCVVNTSLQNVLLLTLQLSEVTTCYHTSKLKKNSDTTAWRQLLCYNCRYCAHCQSSAYTSATDLPFQRILTFFRCMNHIFCLAPCILRVKLQFTLFYGIACRLGTNFIYIRLFTIISVNLTDKQNSLDTSYTVLINTGPETNRFRDIWLCFCGCLFRELCLSSPLDRATGFRRTVKCLVFLLTLTLFERNFSSLFLKKCLKWCRKTKSNTFENVGFRTYIYYDLKAFYLPDKSVLTILKHSLNLLARHTVYTQLRQLVKHPTAHGVT